MWAIRKNSGFTIVELLIVIVVIGILAAIVIVSFNGISETAQKTAIASELKQWHKLFELYKAQYGHYPAPSATPTTGGGPGTSAPHVYCLGTGFPQHGGASWCYDVHSTSNYRVSESTGAALLTELRKVGTPPTNSAKYVYGRTVGPILIYGSGANARLQSTFPYGTDCVKLGLTTGYTNGSTRQDCTLSVSYTP